MTPYSRPEYIMLIYVKMLTIMEEHKWAHHMEQTEQNILKECTKKPTTNIWNVVHI